jgi:hypothetical protein
VQIALLALACYLALTAVCLSALLLLARRARRRTDR